MKRILPIILVMTLSISMILGLTACSTSDFETITDIDRFDEIERITIVYNNYIVDGHVSGAIAKDYTEDRDILEIYNILARAKYRAGETDVVSRPKYNVRLYVKGESGYIEYGWDMSFEAKDGYSGKLKAGFYSMDDAHIAEAKLEDIFYRN